jgi:hypothetical protein
MSLQLRLARRLLYPYQEDASAGWTQANNGVRFLGDASQMNAVFLELSHDEA